MRSTPFCGQGRVEVDNSMRLKGEDGVAMTEFALVIPIFLIVVAGLLAFGRVFFYWIEANHLANETARWAAVDRRPDPGRTLQAYAHDSGGTTEFSNAKVCIQVPVPLRAAPVLGGPIEVKISKRFSFVPILGIGDVTIRGSATMRVERFANGAGTTPSYTYNTTTNPTAGSPYGACT
jgi:Flp pilus assembly protein TadG